MRLPALVLLVVLALAGCASTPRPEALVPVNERDPAAHLVPLLVATSRGLDGAGGFSNERSRTLNFQKIVLSIPPDHKTGEIEWQDGPVGDPKRHFVTLENRLLDEAAFRAAIDGSISPSGDVMVFVHGYNTNHEDGVFRLGQIAADLKVQAVPILFSWPSRGQIKDYLTDRESTLMSRNRLRQFLSILAAHPRVRRIDVLAHSMGTFLTMETLVHAKLSGDGEFRNKLNMLVLAAPDIDVDVFMTQFEIIGRRPRPTTIMISRDDKALQVSSRLAGDVVRVGAASPRARASVEAIERLGFTVIDLTDLESSDRANHTKFAASPPVVRQLGEQIRRGLGGTAATPVGSFVVNATGTVIEAPARIFNQVTGRQ